MLWFPSQLTGKIHRLRHKFKIEKCTNTIIGRDFDKLKRCVESILSSQYKKGQPVEKWDGNAAKKIIENIEKIYFNR